jgi:arsenite methyltransferase
MKPDYRNWIPKGMIHALTALTGVLFVLLMIFGVFGLGVSRNVKIVLTIVLALGDIVSAKCTEWAVHAYKAFSYDGERKLSRDIIEGTAEYVNIPDGGKALDVGCGSGALAIAVAKLNPNAQVVGVDRWGKEYASFSLPLCSRNAEAEGVKNVRFMKGDATHLDFPDESFDAVTSNYVYHNISGKDKQTLLLETLRVLKKGGTFAIHDLMSPRRYGDMNAFVRKLQAMGYERVELIDTAKGMFMTEGEAKRLMLTGSTLLTGRK